MENKNKTLIVIGIALFIIGLILLIFSTNLGVFASSIALWKNGGGMDTNQYLLIMKSNMISYQIIGALFSFLGSVLIAVSINNIKKL